MTLRPRIFVHDGYAITFLPVGANASSYTWRLNHGRFDRALYDQGEPAGLADNESRRVPLPFGFPYFGRLWQDLYLNSSGAVSFGEPMRADTEIMLAKVNLGPPAILAAYAEVLLSRSTGGVRFLARPDLFAVTWLDVTVMEPWGTPNIGTFQLRLYPDGRIDLEYVRVPTVRALLGLVSGNTSGKAELVSFALDAPREFSSTLVERIFFGYPQPDLVTVAQRFFATHEDAYDFLIVYSALPWPGGYYQNPSGGTVVLRDSTAGIGRPPIDEGLTWASGKRLRSVINMGDLYLLFQFGEDNPPAPPDGIIPLLSSQEATPMSTLAHQVGHLFGAFVSVERPELVRRFPMLDLSHTHWSYYLNNGGSFLGGYAFVRDGADSRGEIYRCLGLNHRYSELDLYLMGLIPIEHVPKFSFIEMEYDTSPFLSDYDYGCQSLPGVLRQIDPRELIDRYGPRAPDHRTSQKQWRAAFIVLIPDQGELPYDRIAQVDTYRLAFENYFFRHTQGLARMETELTHGPNQARPSSPPRR
ncbi:MAG: hypothetical protein KIT09_06050 [Bryobacteraceae bacterium]|nr:hypothetical protein [Bryobacteraceae bacterium]